MEEGLEARVKFFVQDLLQFGSDKGGAGQRLRHDVAAGATFYLSSVYFTQDEITTMLASQNGEGVTLDQALQAVVARKLQDGARLEICTSHDLAPVFQAFLGVRKGFQQDAEHMRLYKKFTKEWSKKHRPAPAGKKQP